MRILASLLFFLLAIQGVANPDAAYVTNIQLKHTFEFDPYPDVHGKAVNSILQTIAEGSGKLRVFTKYTFFMDVEAKTQWLEDNRYSLTLSTGKKSVTGDVVYRDFSLEKVLVPDKADLTVIIRCSKGNLLFQETLQSLVVQPENETLFQSDFYFDGNAGALEITIIDVFFYYDDRIYERFSDWAIALESYYATGDKLYDIQNMINGLNPSDPNMLLLEEFTLCDAEAAMGNIHYAPFHHWVNIREYDPQGYFPVYEKLYFLLDSLRNVFNHAIIHIDSLYYEHALELARDTCLSVGSACFASAVSYNPFHIPSHLALMQIEVLQGDKAAAIQRLGNIYKIMHPDGFIKNETDKQADSLLGIFYDASWQLIVEKKYLESLAVLDNVRGFCKQTNGKYPCPPFLDILTRQNHLGMYESFIIVSSRALRNDNLELASIYIGSAIDYQTEYQQYITNNNMAMELLFRILTRYRVLSEMSVIFDDQPEADRYRSHARQLLEQHPALFEYLKSHASTEEINTAVLNYAVLSSHHNSIELLEILRNKGVQAAKTDYQQRIAGKHAAQYYRKHNPGVLPGELFGNLNVHAPWYRAFRQSFLDNWK